MRHKKVPWLKRGLRRLRNGRQSGLKAAAAVSAAAATVIGVVNATGMTFTLWQIAAGLGVAGAAGVLRALRSGSESLLPMAICERKDETYKASFCTEQSLREANEWTIPLYGIESVSSDVAIQWMLRNPKAFVALENDQGALCASFGMIGIKPECVPLHIRGDLLDSDLKAGDVLTLAETKKSDHTYISGVVVRDAQSQVGHRRATVMIWVMLMYTKRVLGLRRKRLLYAIAVSKEAKRLLQNIGFVVHTPGNRRKDKCDLFTYELTESSWESLLARIGDHSPMCKLEFIRPKS